MRNPKSRRVQRHDKVNTNHHCRRCASLSIRIQKNWTLDWPEVIAQISAKSLQLDCALCVQFSHVFELIHGSFTHHDLILSYLVNGNLQAEGTTIGMQFESFYQRKTVKILPIQTTKFSYPQVVRQIVCPDEPDYQFIRTQLDICNRSHGQDCLHEMVGKHVQRVIDCKSRRLVTAKPGEPYACLSYVWGSSITQETQSSGDELPTAMPKTIEDAMAVAIALKVPFLWVDRYCIDQGNLQEKHDTIQNMNRIYEGAVITIIAAFGDDPHHGLPGVRGTPRKPQLSLTLADTTFLALDPIYDEINTTKWAERGWTYQEMLLSRRRLVFTNTQMYFQCRAAHCTESLHPSFTASNFALSPQFQAFPSKGIGHTVDDLLDRLVEYYKRQLSFDTDIINAFKGIISAFDQSESFPFRLTHFYGVLLMYTHDNEDLVRQSFLSNLAWAVTKDENLDGPFHDKQRMNLFPSWSWASTKTKLLQGCFRALEFQSRSLRCDDVQVYFTHKENGDIDLCTFSKHRDSYEMFLPLIKLTTWIFSWPIHWDSDGVPFLFDFKLNTEFQPEASCHRIHIAYLGTENLVEHSPVVVSLILEEVEPGVFRRIGQEAFEVPLTIGDTKSTYEILDMALSKGKDNAVKFSMTFDKEDVSQTQLEKRTITIV